MDMKGIAKSLQSSLVRIEMVDGSTKCGIVQVPPPNTNDDLVWTLDQGKSKVLPEGQTHVSLQEYQRLVDQIPLSTVKSIDKIETKICNFIIKTENGKPINQDYTEIQVRNAGRAGFVAIKYKMPGSETWSREFDVPILNGEVKIPVTMAFISYAKEERDRIIEIINRLRRQDIFVWEDESLLLPGDDWEAKIENAIENADFFLFFMSSDTIERDGYKNRALFLALKKQSLKASGKRFIIPILLDKCNPPKELSGLHWLRRSEKDWESKLVRAIGPVNARKDL
jgi:hypothetical protein